MICNVRNEIINPLTQNERKTFAITTDAAVQLQCDWSSDVSQ